MIATSKCRPRISIVAASRNDDHGGDILKRTRLFVRGLLAQSRRHRLPAELILVEWNPPADRPPLRDVLPAAEPGDYLKIRYIVVPESVHRQYRRAPEVPLFQMIAKNVGIRRAEADFVLCTNVDLLFSDKLMNRLATETLSDDAYYRCNRCDVPDGIDERWDLDQQLEWCEQNVIRRLGRDPQFRHVNLEALNLQAKSYGKKWIFDKLALPMRLVWSEGEQAFLQLDSFACGDFTMMSKAAWNAIRGYVELDLYSLHVDTLGLVSATALGFRQHVYPVDACTYHIDHPTGWSAMTPFEKLQFVEERPAIDFSLLREVGIHALQNGEPVLLNDEDWGHSERDFDEFTIPTGGEFVHGPEIAAASRGH